MNEANGTARGRTAYSQHLAQKLLSGLTSTDGGEIIQILQAEDLDHDPAPGSAPWPADRLNETIREFGKNSLDGILAIDLLGRLPEPATLFEQAQSSLKPGGRLVMIEPGVSLLSWPFYYFFGDRRVDFSHSPLDNHAARHGQHGNLATASHLFNFLEHRIELMERFPTLHCIHQEWMSILTGPLARGIGNASLLPEPALHPLLALENKLMPFIGRWSASKLFIVLEKRATTSRQPN
ncbi:methyltransferase domain-containing protein [Aestuariispira insulae]|uniref:Methyltransferase family protein n=1 Tax=Aestuariispira insulae TaxID=1461337 RepID=A0A3D9HGB4_9PROT|nr:methyltransferase domain-containing protein [Aestuariispira insulae]RED48504.1 methyltransferase family protein [Aestuariispira insulae]